MFIWESHVEMPSYLQDRLIKSFDHHSRFWNTGDELFVSQSNSEYIAPITTYNNLSHFTKVEGLLDFYADIVEKMMKEVPRGEKWEKSMSDSLKAKFDSGEKWGFMAGNYDTMLKFLEEIIRNISGRTYQIKNAIEWNKFQAGYN